MKYHEHQLENRTSMMQCPKCRMPHNLLEVWVVKNKDYSARRYRKLISCHCEKCQYELKDVKVPKGRLISRIDSDNTHPASESAQ